MMKSREIAVPVGAITLKGSLAIPEGAAGFVIFSHGSGSSRFSPRNNFVAEVLYRNKIASLLTDLLTEDEDRIYENRFNIDLITERLVKITQHVQQLPELASLPVGYFGASTGAASALSAAAELDDVIQSVVSRGGRPDLAGNALPLVKAPTLLIVGSLDKEVIELNEQAYAELSCEKSIEIVEGASHLFEEAGTLEEVASKATYWFKKHLAKPFPELTLNTN